MPVLRPGAESLMKYWGEFESAANARLNTADFVQAIRSAAARAGESLTGVDALAIGQLRSIAVRIRNAAAAYAKAGPTATIDASMIAEAPWARTPAQQAVNPLYQVRFQLETTGPQGRALEWKSFLQPLALPATNDELVNSLTDYAQGLADKYHTSFGSIGSIQLLAV